MYLAYKFVAVAVMLAEANYCAQRIGLPENLPLTNEKLAQTSVPDPGILSFGRLDTAKYSFCFGDPQRLCFVHRIDPYSGLSDVQARAKFAGVKPVMSTEDAYWLATNWLGLLSVDLQQLGKLHAARVEQLLHTTVGGEPKRTPFFDIMWGTPPYEKVNIRIDGRTRELIYLRIEDRSFGTRPVNLLKDVNKLLEIPDSEFLSYSEDERNKLVSRFAAISYSTNLSTHGEVRLPTNSETRRAK